MASSGSLAYLAILATAAVLPLTSAGPLSSYKRGLVFTPNASTPADDYIWRRPPSDLTWYYNYGSTPSSVYSNWTQAEFEFVPMLWGAPSNPATNTSFLQDVTQLISGGTNVSHALAFNEPDGPAAYGGSNVAPSVAAQVWVNNFEPLRNLSVKVGLPACTGAESGLVWLQEFLGNCSALVSAGGATRNCSYDFVPLHWYGNFEGLASHIGEYAAAFPNTSLWITEYNYDNQDLATTQSFYNTSAEYFDRLDYVARYALFGAFRADQSNVGPYAAMLSDDGRLTDMGAWYLGEQGTGVDPTSGAPVVAPPRGVGLPAVVAVGVVALLGLL